MKDLIATGWKRVDFKGNTWKREEVRITILHNKMHVYISGETAKNQQGNVSRVVAMDANLDKVIESLRAAWRGLCSVSI